MRIPRLLSIGLLWLVLVTAQASTRDFLASIRYQYPMIGKDQVQVLFTLRLWNLGGHNLTGGKLILRELHVRTPRHELFNAIDLPKSSSKLLRGYVLISPAEFQAWEKGANPSLSLKFVDDTGTPQQFPVDVTRMLGVDDEN